MNIFMNFVKKPLIERTKDRVRISKEVKALLLVVSDLFAGPWGPTSLFYSLIRSAKGLL